LVIAITLTTNLYAGLVTAVLVGTAFSFVDAIEPNGRLIDALSFAVGYAVTAVLVDVARRAAAREAILSREHLAATATHDRMLPTSLPELGPWQVKVVHVPLGDLGGDFYDFRKRGDDLGLLACDVSGKGLRAAMLLGAVKVLFQEMPLVAVGERLERMNDAFMPVCEDGMFCTAWYGQFGPDGSVRFSVAGHEPGYMRSAGVITALPYGGLPLGVMPASTYPEHELHLAQNDMLVLHTDGISELLANNSISVEDLFASLPDLERRIRAAVRRDDALLVVVTRRQT
jgi:sigma-B regulation protein RsbU (phosphoserine phosphatase)